MLPKRVEPLMLTRFEPLVQPHKTGLQTTRFEPVLVMKIEPIQTTRIEPSMAFLTYVDLEY